MLQHPKSQRQLGKGTVANKYVMPGLCPEIVKQFRRKPGVIPHARTIAMNADIESGAVYPALIYTLFEKVEQLERKIDGRRPAFGLIQGGRAA